ncbi:hypothetical protein EC988_003242 [Linderina pennispora]|nr:hypothetical protein EC988_003242 [Linderina pennispora]
MNSGSTINGYSLQLPSMREEDHYLAAGDTLTIAATTAALLSGSAIQAATQGMLPPPLQPPTPSAASSYGNQGLLSANSYTSVSPVRHDTISEVCKQQPGIQAVGSTGPDNTATGPTPFLQMHVRPSLDTRRPSLDNFGSRSINGYLDQPVATAVYPPTPAQPLNMSVLHRRHSLASTGLHMSGRHPAPEVSQFTRTGFENGRSGSIPSDGGTNCGGGPQLLMANASSDFQRYQFFGQAASMNPGPPVPPLPSQMQASQSALGGGGMPFTQNAMLNTAPNAPLSPLEQQQQQQQQQQMLQQQQHMHQLMLQQQMGVRSMFPGPMPMTRMPNAGSTATTPGQPGALPRPSFIGNAPLMPQPMPQSASAQKPMAQPAQQHTTQPTPPPPHMRRASHPALNHLAAGFAPGGMSVPPSSMPGGSSTTQHTMMPNPATTITPNMPFADMGKGIAYQSLPKEARIYIVQFKGRRCDLYFTAGANIEVKIFPVATGGSAIPVPASSAASASDGTAKPAKGSGDVVKPGTKLESGTCVLVEADRGVDLGVIKEELTTLDEVKKFIGQQAAAIAAAVGNSGMDSHSSEPEHKLQHQPQAGGKEARVSAMPVPSLSVGAQPVSVKDIYIKRIFREADQREIADVKENKAMDEQKALAMCQSKVLMRRLSMRVVDAEFQFDRRKLTFYFTADRRVDFRELVRELFKHFKTRIWMCQQTN